MATYLEVLEQIEKLKQEAAHLKEKEVGEVVERIRLAIQAYGLTADDLGLNANRVSHSSEQGGGTVSRHLPKYRDASGNVWSGRGPRPRWLKKALAEGVDLESLRT